MRHVGGHQNHACSWSSLGPDRGMGAGTQPGSKQHVLELLFRATNLVSDSLVRNHPCHVWVVWLSGGLSMREVRNHGPPPIAWRLPLRLPNSESLGHPPTVPPFALRRPGGEHVPSGDSLPNCSRGGTRVRTALRNPTFPWTMATMRTLHTGSSPRPDSQRNVPLNQGSQPAEENWHVQPHNATE